MSVITQPRNPLKGSGRRDPETRSRRRFARRQWLRRWLVWRYVIASVLLVVVTIGVVWLVFVPLDSHVTPGLPGWMSPAQWA